MSSIHEAIVAFEMKRDQQLGAVSSYQPLVPPVQGNSKQFVGTLSKLEPDFNGKTCLWFQLKSEVKARLTK